MEIVTRGNPEEFEAIERDFKPVEYRENDVSGFELMSFGFPPGLKGRFRVGVIYAVDKRDSNKLKHLARILGPATGENQLSIPCGGVVEWAWVQEAVEMRAELAGKRAIDKAVRLNEMQAEINRQLPDIAGDMEMQKRGASTFGYGGKLQRSIG